MIRGWMSLDYSAQEFVCNLCGGRESFPPLKNNGDLDRAFEKWSCGHDRCNEKKENDMSGKVDYSGLASKCTVYAAVPEDVVEWQKHLDASKQWLPLGTPFPKPGRFERLCGPRLYRRLRDFWRSIPYWRLRPCNSGCFLYCKGHTAAYPSCYTKADADRA